MYTVLCLYLTSIFGETNYRLGLGDDFKYFVCSPICGNLRDTHGIPNHQPKPPTTGWWFQIFCIFTHIIFGNDSHVDDHIFFRWVELTNQ